MEEVENGFVETQQQQQDTYVFVKFLGQGSFGRVNLYRNTTDNTLVVWKEIDMRKLDSKMRDEAFAEVEILSLLDHPNIISYYKHFIGDDILYIELQYAKAGTLTNLIQQQKKNEQYFDEETALWYIYQLCNAVDYIHEIGIMHRDIKSLNIFFMQSNLLKLGDFGIAKILDKEIGLLESQVGTPFYMSPEIIEGKKYSIKSDIWSVGCVMYEILTLEKVFDATNQLKLALKISTSNVNEIDIDIFSMELRQLVKKVLSKNPDERPTAREILNEPLFASRESLFKEKIETLNFSSKRKTTTLSSYNSNDSDTQNTTNQSIIASKLSEVYIWGGGKLSPKQIDFFKNENAPLNVALGPSHYAVVTVEKELFTWSASDGGGGSTKTAKLGHGKVLSTRSPKRVEALNGISIEFVACGEEFTCCVSEEGDLYVFGTNYSGCLGLGNLDNKFEENNELEDISTKTNKNEQYTPTIIPFFKQNDLKISKIATGDLHVIVLTTNNRVFTWGCGEFGRLGHGDEEDRNKPTELKFEYKYIFKDVFAGSDCSFLLTREGRVLAFGNNEFNKLCLNVNSIGFKNENSKMLIQESSQIPQQLTPKLIEQLSKYKIFKICPGLHHTAVIDDFGRLFTFGSNKYGQLGVGDTKPRPGLNLIGGSLVGYHVTNAALGDSFTICATSENHVYSWGNRSNGRLGIDSSFDEAKNCLTKPKPIFGSLHLVSDMKCKYWHSIIIAEQILNTKPMRNLSYVDYKQLKENITNTNNLSNNSYDVANTESYSSYDNPHQPKFNLDQNSNLEDVIDYEKIIITENEINDTTDIPEWLKNDIRDCEYIPIDALNKSMQKIGNKKEDTKSNPDKIYNLEEAKMLIKKLREENLKLKEENKMLLEKLQMYENK